MTYTRRLIALERRFAVRATCPNCRDWPEPLVLRGTGESPRCPACGRQPLTIRIVRDRNFYGNANRLPASD
jgi:hypothetical protein